MKKNTLLLLLLVLTSTVFTACDGATKVAATVTTPVVVVPPVVSALKVSSVKASLQSTFSLDSHGDLWAVGTNVAGEFGDGTALGAVVTTPVTAVMSDVADFAVVDDFTMVVKTDGTLWAAGDNDHGQFGNGTTTDATTFVNTGVTGVASVATGDNYTMIVKTDGTLWAAGSNVTGQFGNGTTADATTFVNTGVTGVAKVAASKRPWAESTEGSTAIIKTDGSLWVTGLNLSGQLGLGTNTNVNTFTEATSITANVTNISVAAYGMAAVTDDGKLYVAGDNWFGQLGLGNNTFMNTFTAVTSVTNVTSADMSQSSLAVVADGNVYVSGDNFFGNFGNGTTAGANALTQITGITGAKEVFANIRNTYIVTTGGNLLVTGNNVFGQLGDGSTADRVTFAAVTSN